MNKSSLLLLGFLATLSFVSFGVSPHDNFHPLITMASLLPLQIGTLLWLKWNDYLKIEKIQNKP